MRYKRKECEIRKVRHSDLKNGRVVVFEDGTKYAIISNMLYELGKPTIAVGSMSNRDLSDIAVVARSTTGFALVQRGGK